MIVIQVYIDYRVHHRPRRPSLYFGDVVVRQEQVGHRDRGAGDFIQLVMLEVDGAQRGQPAESSFLDAFQSVVAQVNEQQGRNTAEGRGLDLFQMIVSEIELTEREQVDKNTLVNRRDVVVGKVYDLQLVELRERLLRNIQDLKNRYAIITMARQTLSFDITM